MTRKGFITTTLLTAALLSAVGCQKNAGPEGIAGIGFSVSVAGQGGAKSAGTKAVLYNSAEDIQTDGNSFACSAYNTTKSKSVFTGETVTYSGGKWSTSTAYTWQPGETLTFHAVYPTAAAGTDDGKAVIAADGTGISITDYAVADNAAAQDDIMLGMYSGDGKVSGKPDGTAAITFQHPFTAVRFKMGDLAEFIPGFTGISSITISNVYAGGSLAKWSGSGDFVWTPATTTKGVTMTVGETPTKGEAIVGSCGDFGWATTKATKADTNGDPIEGSDANAKAFTLIPQDLNSKAATITVSYTATTNGSIVATVSKVSETGTKWEAGKVYTYTVNFKTMPLTILDNGSFNPVNGWTTETVTAPVEAEDAK